MKILREKILLFLPLVWPPCHVFANQEKDVFIDDYWRVLTRQILVV